MHPLASAGLRTIAFDLPGFGLSDAPSDHSAAYRREFVPKFLDAMGLERAALVGHSNLGNAAVMLALREPSRYSHIIALGTGSLLPPLPDERANKVPDFILERGRITAEPTREETRKRMESYLYHHELITPEELERRHRFSTGSHYQEFVARKRAAISRQQRQGPPLWTRLPALQVPLLMIYGREDRGDAGERAELLKSLYPWLNLHIVDHCKHLLPWDAADEFVRLAVQFFADASESGSRAGTSITKSDLH